jgi:trk system potassium uptake protein TrkA
VRVVIIGCGRTGAMLAEILDGTGHAVTIVDVRTSAFNRLAATFKGRAVRADGTDEDALRRAEAEGADLFLALTEGDNRNIMAAQMAREALAIPSVYAKVNDPVRARAYAELGIGTMCRTTLIVDALLEAIGQETTGEPSVLAGRDHQHDDTPPLGPTVVPAAAREG